MLYHCSMSLPLNSKNIYIFSPEIKAKTSTLLLNMLPKPDDTTFERTQTLVGGSFVCICNSYGDIFIELHYGYMD